MSREVTVRTDVLMGTFVTIEVVGSSTATIIADTISRAFEWFRSIEATCSRFDADSELLRLTTQIGVPVPVSPVLFETIQFALQVAHESGGAFDPTVGHLMQQRGFNREHRTGAIVSTSMDGDAPASYRDVEVDAERRTVTLHRPMVLDLGAVAKGLAVDTAARELKPLGNFAIDAGGDLYLGGRNRDDEPWTVGIRHPRRDDELMDSLQVTDTAVCTSGDYARRTPDGAGHHLLDPRTGISSCGVASATVVAPTAMLADALATAAFVLGPADGISLLDRLGVGGLIVTGELDRHQTRGWGGR